MPVDRKTTNRGILTKNFRRLTDRLYRIHREPNGYAPDRWTVLRRSRKTHRREPTAIARLDKLADENHTLRMEITRLTAEPTEPTDPSVSV